MNQYPTENDSLYHAEARISSVTVFSSVSVGAAPIAVVVGGTSPGRVDLVDVADVDEGTLEKVLLGF